ncbi:MAG: Hpt domain-containing protein [Eubacteriales bacterium]
MVIYTKLTKAGVNTDTLLQRLMGNDSLIRVFIKKFTEDGTIAALRAAFADKDMKAAEMASHTLKGICGNLSLDELYALFTQQTDLIRSGEYAKAEEMMASIESKYSSAIVLMKEWLEEI